MKHSVVLPPDLESMIKPFISISPFSYHTLSQTCGDNIDQKYNCISINKELRNHLGRDFFFTNSGRHALDLVLDHLKLKQNDVVSIFTSLGNYYVSGCVTKTIEKYCKWSMDMEPKTKAILVIHEWGIPHPGIKQLCKLGFPVIEDCAYAFASADDSGLVGKHGNYAIYSLTKFFSVNFGGIVCGLSNLKFNMSEIQENYICRLIGRELFDIDEVILKRISNWNYLKSLFSSVNAEPYFELKPKLVPGVFMFKADTCLSLEEIKAQYWKHYIECSVFYGTNAIYIPCNQSLNKGSLEYMFAVYRSMLFGEKNV